MLYDALDMSGINEHTLSSSFGGKVEHFSDIHGSFGGCAPYTVALGGVRSIFYAKAFSEHYRGVFSVIVVFRAPVFLWFECASSLNHVLLAWFIVRW